MTNHPTPAELESYRQRRLQSRELLAVDDHLAQCPECRRAASMGLGAGTALWRVLEAVQGEHLPYDLIERYVDGETSSDERKRVTEHSVLCEVCAGEIADLESFHLVQQRRPWPWWALGAAAAAAIVLVILAFPRLDDAKLQPGGVVARKAPVAMPPVAKSATVPETPVVAEQRDPLESLQPSLRRVAAALDSGSLASVAMVASLRRGQEAQRAIAEGEALPVQVAAPLGVVVEEDRPAFRWSRQKSRRVTVQVFDLSYALVAESTPLTSSSWQPPKALLRGKSYQWQLLVHDENDETITAPAPPQPPALFHVIAADAYEELRAARAAGSPLEIGLICMREGLFEEGAKMLSGYADARSSEVASRLASRARAVARKASS